MANATNAKLSQVPEMDVGTIIETLSGAYVTIIKNNYPITTMPSVMLWGAPGVGKSQAVKEIAKEIQEQTGKKTVVTDVRLVLFNPIDLRGIPTANADKTLAVWLKPKIFDMDAGKNVVNILFLDEITSAPQSVQAAAYQITLDRVIGEHKLPDNCIVIAAGNRTTDKSVAYKMPKALANRLMHIDVEGNFESWRKWAVENGINKKVLGFLSFKQNLLFGFNASSEDLAFATPRSWEMVSNVLNCLADDINAVYPLIAGLVGTGIAIELKTWANVYEELPKIEDIFKGKCKIVPQSTDALYALTAAMTSYASEHRRDIGAIANSIEYAQALPPDFSTVLMRNYMSIEKGFEKKLLSIPEFAKWLNTKGRLLNGSV